MYLQDSNICVQVMMLIQSRCSSMAGDQSKNTPLSPLHIGSSPLTTRQRGKNGQKVKRKTKTGDTSPSNDENCVNGAGGNPSRRLSAMSMSPGTPLRERCEESPLKKSKNSRRVSSDMEVVDLLGLSDLPTTPMAKSNSAPVDLLTSCADSAQLAQISQSALLKSYFNDYEKLGESVDSIISRMKSDGVDALTINEFQRQCQDLEEKKRIAVAASEDPLSKYQVYFIIMFLLYNLENAEIRYSSSCSPP